jgi:GalNAc-alpha-(1->4)-GalNAc-alpha-(1->3)-diNAcBac-PP-undecaprenol alpha-1,4-N-acetyl-D-galactosaminyltransferase
VLLLRQALKRMAADAVISFIDRTNVVTLLAGLGLGLPVIVAERTDPAMLPSGKLWNILCRSTYPLAARVVVQSPEAADYYRPSLRRQPVVIPNPVPPAEQMAEEYFHLKRPSIIAIGRFTLEKGFDLLLDAFARIAHRHVDWTLTIFGDGPLRLVLKRRCNDLDLQGRVKMPGLIANVQAVLQQADLFVLPSRFEGFPNALCEAMACGVASIATDCPSGPRQIIRHQVDGILVPNEDVDALALNMDCLMSDPLLRQRLGKRSVEVVRRFSVQKIVGMWEFLLDQVVNAHRVPTY